MSYTAHKNVQKGFLPGRAKGQTKSQHEQMLKRYLQEAKDTQRRLREATRNG